MNIITTDSILSRIDNETLYKHDQNQVLLDCSYLLNKLVSKKKQTFNIIEKFFLNKKNKDESFLLILFFKAFFCLNHHKMESFYTKFFDEVLMLISCGTINGFEGNKLSEYINLMIVKLISCQLSMKCSKNKREFKSQNYLFLICVSKSQYNINPKNEHRELYLNIMELFKFDAQKNEKNKDFRKCFETAINANIDDDQNTNLKNIWFEHIMYLLKIKSNDFVEYNCTSIEIKFNISSNVYNELLSLIKVLVKNQSFFRYEDCVFLNEDYLENLLKVYNNIELNQKNCNVCEIFYEILFKWFKTRKTGAEIQKSLSKKKSSRKRSLSITDFSSPINQKLIDIILQFFQNVIKSNITIKFTNYQNLNQKDLTKVISVFDQLTKEFDGEDLSDVIENQIFFNIFNEMLALIKNQLDNNVVSNYESVNTFIMLNIHECYQCQNSRKNSQCNCFINKILKIIEKNSEQTTMKQINLSMTNFLTILTNAWGLEFKPTVMRCLIINLQLFFTEPIYNGSFIPDYKSILKVSGSEYLYLHFLNSLGRNHFIKKYLPKDKLYIPVINDNTKIIQQLEENIQKQTKQYPQMKFSFYMNVYYIYLEILSLARETSEDYDLVIALQTCLMSLQKVIGHRIHKVFIQRIFSFVFLRDKDRALNEIVNDDELNVDFKIRAVSWVCLFSMITCYDEDLNLPTPSSFIMEIVKKILTIYNYDVDFQELCTKKIESKKVQMIINLASVVSKMLNYNLPYAKCIVPILFYYNDVILNNFQSLVKTYKNDSKLCREFFKIGNFKYNTKFYEQEEYRKFLNHKEAFSYYLLETIIRTTKCLMNITFQYQSMQVLITKEMKPEIIEYLTTYQTFMCLQKRIMRYEFFNMIFNLVDKPELKECYYKNLPCDITHLNLNTCFYYTPTADPNKKIDSLNPKDLYPDCDKKAELNQQALTMLYIAIAKLLRTKHHEDAWKLTQMITDSIISNDFIIVTKCKFKFIEAIINLSPKFFDNVNRFEYCFKIFRKKLSKLRKDVAKTKRIKRTNLLGCMLHLCLKMIYSVSKDKVHTKQFEKFLIALHQEEEKQHLDSNSKDVIEIFYLHLIHYKWSFQHNSMMKENSIFNESSIIHSKKIEEILSRIKYIKPKNLELFKEIMASIGVEKRLMSDAKLSKILKTNDFAEKEDLFIKLINDSSKVNLESYMLIYIDNGTLLSLKESEGEQKVIQRGPGGKFSWCLKEVDNIPLDALNEIKKDENKFMSHFREKFSETQKHKKKVDSVHDIKKTCGDNIDFPLMYKKNYDSQTDFSNIMEEDSNLFPWNQDNIMPELLNKKSGYLTSKSGQNPLKKEILVPEKNSSQFTFSNSEITKEQSINTASFQNDNKSKFASDLSTMVNQNKLDESVILDTEQINKQNTNLIVHKNSIELSKESLKNPKKHFEHFQNSDKKNVKDRKINLDNELSMREVEITKKPNEFNISNEKINSKTSENDRRLTFFYKSRVSADGTGNTSQQSPNPKNTPTQEITTKNLSSIITSQKKISEKSTKNVKSVQKKMPRNFLKMIEILKEIPKDFIGFPSNNLNVLNTRSILISPRGQNTQSIATSHDFSQILLGNQNNRNSNLLNTSLVNDNSNYNYTITESNLALFKNETTINTGQNPYYEPQEILEFDIDKPEEDPLNAFQINRNKGYLTTDIENTTINTYKSNKLNNSYSFGRNNINSKNISNTDVAKNDFGENNLFTLQTCSFNETTIKNDLKNQNHFNSQNINMDNLKLTDSIGVNQAIYRRKTKPTKIDIINNYLKYNSRNLGVSKPEIYNDNDFEVKNDNQQNSLELSKTRKNFILIRFLIESSIGQPANEKTDYWSNYKDINNTYKDSLQFDSK